MFSNFRKNISSKTLQRFFLYIIHNVVDRRKISESEQFEKEFLGFFFFLFFSSFPNNLRVNSESMLIFMEKSLDNSFFRFCYHEMSNVMKITEWKLFKLISNFFLVPTISRRRVVVSVCMTYECDIAIFQYLIATNPSFILTIIIIDYGSIIISPLFGPSYSQERVSFVNSSYEKRNMEIGWIWVYWWVSWMNSSSIDCHDRFHMEIWFLFFSFLFSELYFAQQQERCHENDSTEPVVCQPWSSRLSKMAQPNLDFMGKSVNGTTLWC